MMRHLNNCFVFEDGFIVIDYYDIFSTGVIYLLLSFSWLIKYQQINGFFVSCIQSSHESRDSYFYS